MRVATVLVLTLVASACIRLGGAHTFAIPAGHTFLTATSADTTGQGRHDLIVLTDQGLLRVRYCGAGCFTVEQDLAVTFSATAVLGIAAGDVDGDSIDDVVVFVNEGPFATSTFRTFFGSTAGNGRVAGLDLTDTASSSLSSYLGSGLLDFNGDGWADLLTNSFSAGFSQTAVWLGNGAGGFTTQAVGGITSPVGFMQFDGLGDLERYRHSCSTRCFFTIWDDTGIRAMLNLPTGTTGTAGDHNGDGLDDVITHTVPTVGDPMLEVRLSNGTGLQPPVATPTAAFPLHLRWGAVADHGADGHADLVGFDAITDELVWLNGNGSTGFSAPFGVSRFRYPLGFDAVPLAVGDLTADGRLDFLLLDNGANPAELVVLENDSPEL